MEIDPKDLLYIGVNMILLFGFYLKIEKRLTRIETIIKIRLKDKD